jgi:hypothetical protein
MAKKCAQQNKWTKPQLVRLGKLNDVAGIGPGSQQCNGGGQQCNFS